MAQVTLDIMRPGAISRGHRPAPTKVATVTVEVIPLSPDAVARTIAPALLTDELLYNQFELITVDAYGTPLVPCPDIRMGPPGDLLVDNATPNLSAGTSTTTYVVHGVNAFDDAQTGPFLSVRAQVQAQPSQTGG